MEIERETLVEAGVALAGVGLFIVIAVLAGSTFGTDGLSESGALVLVGGMVAFVVVMSALGWWLAGRESGE